MPEMTWKVGDMARPKLLLLVMLAACAKPGPGNFEKYTANEVGVKELEKYIQDPSNPMEGRVEAVVAMVRAGWTMRLRQVLTGCEDQRALTPKVASALIGLLPKLQGEELAPVRDGAFIALGLLPQEERGPFQRSLAEWIFGGLSPDASAEEVKKAVEPKVLVAQICDLGPYGVDGACLLIRHGFAVEKLAQYILSLDDPKAEAKMLSALKAFHKTPNLLIPFSHIEIIGRIRSVEAVEYLLDLALDDSQDPDVRSAAFNAAAEAMDKPERLEGAKDKLLERLYKLLARKDPDDRWAAARYILALEGPKAFSKVMEALKDDGIYPRAIEDPKKTLVDFCKGVVLRRQDPFADIEALLKSKNRVHLALGIVCLKASEDASKVALLRPLFSSRTSLEPVLGDKVTVSDLAQNAADGLALMESLSKNPSGLTEEQVKRKRFYILVDLLHKGEELRKAVEERFRAEPSGK